MCISVVWQLIPYNCENGPVSVRETCSKIRDGVRARLKNADAIETKAFVSEES